MRWSSRGAWPTCGRGFVLWMLGGFVGQEPADSWIRDLGTVRTGSYGDCGAHGGAARSVTGADTGGSTRLGTRPTTRPVAVTSQARE